MPVVPANPFSRTRQPLSLLLEKIYTLPQGKTLRLTRTYELRQRPPESARKILEGGHTDTHTHTHTAPEGVPVKF